MMTRRWTPLFGTAGLLLLVGCAAEYDERWVPPPPPQQTAEVEGVAPSSVEPAKSTNHKSANYQHWTNANTAYEKPGSSTAAASAKAGGSSGQKTAESGPLANKPLTPTEIRTAVPVDKVPNPAKTLATARIKSVWGDVVGQVQSVNVSAGKLTAVDASVTASGDTKSKHVRIDAGRLKYVKGRNLLVTTLSKPDIDKLPKPDQP